MLIATTGCARFAEPGRHRPIDPGHQRFEHRRAPGSEDFGGGARTREIATISLRDKPERALAETDITEGFYDLLPGEFIPGPRSGSSTSCHISAGFRLNFSSRRIGLDNAATTWADPPGGSTLTLG